MSVPATLPWQVVFVQNSTHLAGAQKSLSRLLSSAEMAARHPVLLSANEGWLTHFCDEGGVARLRADFVKPRSVWARWFGGAARFARSTASALQPFRQPGHRWLVHANDHPDSLIALALARQLGAPSVLTLRTPSMSRRDFFKHGCHRHQAVIAVGSELAQAAQAWMAPRPVNLVYNGVTEAELQEPQDAAPGPRSRLLVLGSLSPRKGWQDLVEALLLLESRLPAGHLPQICFLGDCLGRDPHEVLGTARLRRFELIFEGVTADYRSSLRQAACALHPSRSESFGMAALEAVAAGVVLLAAQTGEIAQWVRQPAFLHPPGDVSALADRLQALLEMGSVEEIRRQFDLPAAQAYIAANLSTSSTLSCLRRVYESLALGAKEAAS